MSLANTLESMYWIFEDKERGSYNGVREDLFDRVSFDRSAFNDFTRESDILCMESPDTPALIFMARDEKGRKALEELLYDIQKVTYGINN